MNPIFESSFGPIGQRRRNEQARQKFEFQISHVDMQLFDGFRPFGYVFFNNEICERQSLKLFDHDIIKFLTHDYWLIKPANQFHMKKWERRFSFMVLSQTTGVQVTNVLWPNILNSICNIGFLSLTHLNVYSCGIVNIESLSLLDAPNLKILNLIYNKVYNFKSLSKTNFQLERLFVYAITQQQENKIRLFCSLPYSERWNFSLKSLRLEKHSYNSTIMNDLSFLSKIKKDTKNGLNVHVSIKNRINQNKLCEKTVQQSLVLLIINNNEALIQREFNHNAWNLDIFQVQRR